MHPVRGQTCDQARPGSAIHVTEMPGLDQKTGPGRRQALAARTISCLLARYPALATRHTGLPTPLCQPVLVVNRPQARLTRPDIQLAALAGTLAKIGQQAFPGQDIFYFLLAIDA